MYTVITENDESQWEDQTGVLYHFPKRYKKDLLPGTEVIYYKGKLKKAKYREKRLSDEPHYFAKAIIGKVYPDKQSSKGDLFALIESYSPFTTPILAKIDGEYLEVIPENQKANYWRNGVRKIDVEVHKAILDKLTTDQILEPNLNYSISDELNDVSNTFESGTEGELSKRYVNTYERNPKYRAQAIAIHGTSCIACKFDFEKCYGNYAEGFIHIHHVIPVSEFDAPRSIDPEKDLVPLCANCHSVVHRRRDRTLSVDELIKMIKSNAER